MKPRCMRTRREARMRSGHVDDGRVRVAGLNVAEQLFRFVRDEALPRHGLGSCALLAHSWSDELRRAELDNNVQSVLGYVVRWVDAGVGCSKVADLTGILLMEDRETCRISSQHVANWLLHGVVSIEEVEQSLRRVAGVVDEQNAATTGYGPWLPVSTHTRSRPPAN